jgi:pimeloyl-ACP methyl ester carboxylesterase
MSRLDLPALTVFGSLDDHFEDPVAMAKSTAAELGGEQIVVDGAGHYPHVEQPDIVASAILEFVSGLR